MKELPRIIGFCGLQGSGKDTCCKELVKHGYTHDYFAKPVYDLLWKMDPDIYCMESGKHHSLQLLVHAIGWEAAKRKYPQVRHYLQFLGTEAGRDIHGEDCWVYAMERRNRGVHYLAISDVRFANEGYWIHDCGGILVHVVRDTIPYQHDNHRSEKFPIHTLAHYTLTNNGAPSEIWPKIERIITDWRKI